jgi:hypothetical protein
MTFLFSKTERYLLNLLKECRQAKKFRLLKKRYLVTSISSLLLILLLILSFSGMAILSDVQAGTAPGVVINSGEIPESVVHDALELATGIYGHGGDSEIYYQQLLSSYEASVNNNILIIFNPGGWGTKTLEDSPDWMTILEGIKTELISAGYKVAALNYLRTTNNLGGQLHEVEEVVSGYLSKSKDLAKRIDFLTQHNPDVEVILAGESTGTMICDSTMNLLKDNERVYSIQTGSPFWQKNTVKDRTVVVNDNGLVPDAFSKGDFYTVVKSNFKSLLGNEEPDEGKILNIFSAPGHEYWWQNPNVYSQIQLFLKKYFESES